MNPILQIQNLSVRFGVRSLTTYPTNLSISRRNRTQEGPWQVVLSGPDGLRLPVEGELTLPAPVVRHRPV